MASQQQHIIDTIFSMKRKLLRRDDSDADEGDVLSSSNRQDLKRKVHYARGRDADFLADPRPYKKRIEHAGYQRYILQRNPPRFDPDGDVVEPDDEYDDDDDDLEAVEENPYADVRVEHLLAPLTSAADLPTHPALSLAYSSKHLTNLANETGALSRKEQSTIARAKTLFGKLVGDSSFAPDALAGMAAAPFHKVWTNGRTPHRAHGDAEHEGGELPGATTLAEDGQANGTQHHATNGQVQPDRANGTSHDPDGENTAEGEDAVDDVSDTASQQTAHRMTTRARAHAASTPSPPQSPSSGVHAVHPLFAFSADSIPDRDLGLPPNEAEETRMLLMAYVQKQEEIARATSDLYHGLLQADRMRQDVFKWSKAEAHLGEMSDGEDWYDGEEWNLDEDLLKGRDEEEDETAAAGKKSTRQRRKPDKEDRYHVFCTHCADTSGLSRSTNAHRGCPACGASLQNPDDVVVAGLNPSEDYKTSVLSGLSPTIIMECASRGLAFHSYQTSQEIIYQEHLAKGLTEKYNTLSQQMDQLIHDANSQIKALQDKMQAMQTEHTTLETKNHELVKAFKEKSISQQHVHKLYQNLKARVMASQVANAAGDEAEIATHTTRGDRFFDKFPGARTGSAIYSRTGTSQRPGVMTHTRLDSRSSGSGEHQRGGIALGRSYVPNLTGHGLGGRLQSDHSAPMGTPSQAQRSRLPVLGGTRPNAFSNIESGPPYQASPMNRQSLGGGVARNMASFALSGSGQGSRRAGRDENTGLL
ncbi:RXT2-like protein [Ampelomyces quisqualis]|uniref:RXT2-like protein n=1 Tax=Ampelomyces quisqualis TaxID=50730 RepID=A0A6A5Q7M4_AMPQU|nr:RXT2-like protein [Ampelomyces quisqualis]